MPHDIILVFDGPNLKLVSLIQIQMWLPNRPHLQWIINFLAEDALGLSYVIEVFLAEVGLEDTTLLLQHLGLLSYDLVLILLSAVQTL